MKILILGAVKGSTKSSFGIDFATIFLTENGNIYYREDLNENFVHIFILEDPRTYEEAMSSINSKLWKEAINDELEFIISNRSWILTDLPKDCKPLSSKWAVKKNLKANGSIDKFKARLIVRHDNQKKDIDYFDTHSLMTKVSIIRAFIVAASLHGLLVHQMDVKAAFLNGNPEE